MVLTEKLFKVKQYIKDGIIGEEYLGYYIERMGSFVYTRGSKLDYWHSKINEKRIIYSKGNDGVVSTHTVLLRRIKIHCVVKSLRLALILMKTQLLVFL